MIASASSVATESCDIGDRAGAPSPPSSLSPFDSGRANSELTHSLRNIDLGSVVTGPTLWGNAFWVESTAGSAAAAGPSAPAPSPRLIRRRVCRLRDGLYSRPTPVPVHGCARERSGAALCGEHEVRVQTKCSSAALGSVDSARSDQLSFYHDKECEMFVSALSSAETKLRALERDF